MYQQSSTLRRPKNSRQPLWRYLSAERLSDLLKSREVFFTHLPHLEDENEGVLTQRSRERLAIWFEQHNKSSRVAAFAEVESYQEHRKDFYVNCWHMNDHESYLMWKAYAGLGFAIQTTFERVQASFDSSPAAINGGVVEYVDFSRDLTPLGNVFHHVATKDMPYRDEREFRLVFWNPDPCNVDLPRSPNGVRVQVDPCMLIQRVVRNPYFASPSAELEALLEANGIELQDSVVRAKRRR